MIKKLICAACIAATIGCGGGKNTQTDAADTDSVTNIPAFNADSAYAYIEAQCNFGARVPGTEAHRLCGDYLVEWFKEQGLSVQEQTGVTTTCDGKRMNIRNIIASLEPERPERILICAHWDRRPWADSDPDPENHRKPVMGANDGASGVAVMMESARQIKAQRPEVGIDFICFDLEDYGTPYWIEMDEQAEMMSWCLGSQRWAAQPHRPNYRPRFGILLDMVGGQGARFYQEGFSLRYARGVVNQVWAAAERAGYGDYFKKENGGYATDDHLPVNQLAQIPTIDIIPYYPDFPDSSFGPTWHTVNDTPQNIDRATLKAVGQTLLQVIYETK